MNQPSGCGLGAASPCLLRAGHGDTAPSLHPEAFQIGAGWFHFNYRDAAFAGPQFHLGTTSSPWLFFDAQDHALIYDAATGHFSVTVHPESAAVSEPGADTVRRLTVTFAPGE